ncbi:hypothetical protein [Paenibacillus donghaensis]|uniref:C1q domain-containing protein n=1 Tax=Paenibacillus donghaensis TaxID=414771 RepID=A0A2Z2KW77_9BACL|nr:hypothetical protein [Paenibacillus donghaensis]ASA24308.1 hypothetical protein B9T62_28220 [Paenibacillus donghaensis]
MKTTGNLGLKKPEGTDIVDIADLNGNMDVLDTAVAAKVDKVSGKQLSTNDYTAAEKSKLAGIAAGANAYTHPNHTGDVISTGDGVTAIAAGAIVNADVNAAAAIDATKIGTGVVSNTEFGYLDGLTGGIQGQLNGKAPLVTTPQQTTAALTYYVRTDGNDSNNGLANTTGGAFRTIGKAISVIPQIVNHAVTINVAAGTYAEVVTIQGFFGSGRLDLLGDTVVSLSRQATGFYVIHNTIAIYIKGFRATNTAGAGFYASSNLNLGFDACSIISSAPTQPGFDIGGGGMVAVNGCLASNRNAALNVNGAVTVVSYVWQVGTGNAYGISVYFGKVSKHGTQPSGATPEYVTAGGDIGGGGVINPWGDNTDTTRPVGDLSRFSSGGQSIAASTISKIIFTFSANNQKNTCDIPNSRFVAPETGYYLVNCRVGITGASGYNQLMLYVNGSVNTVLAETWQNATNGLTISGASILRLLAGYTVDFHVFVNAAATVNYKDENTHASIIRIA